MHPLGPCDDFAKADGEVAVVNRAVVSRVISELANFDPDELFLLGVSVVGCGVGCFRWFARLRPVSGLGAHTFHRVPLYLAVLAGCGFYALAVLRWSAEEVRHNSSYTALMLFMGGAWLTVTIGFFPWMGIGLRQDALEGRNFAAVLSLSGAIPGVMVAFSGANVGEGPSFWNNVFSGALVTGAFLLVWLALARVGGVAHSVSVERDTAAGLRLGGFLAGQGLLLGRAVAGDWHSMVGTVKDFAVTGWPVVLLLGLAIGVDRLLRPTLRRPRPSWLPCGLAPGLLYLALAIGYVMWLGWWEGARS